MTTLNLWFLRDLRDLLRPHSDRRKRTTNMAGSNCYTGTRGVKGLAQPSRGCLNFGQRGRKSTPPEHYQPVVRRAQLEGPSPENTTLCPPRSSRRGPLIWILLEEFMTSINTVVKTCTICNSVKPRPERSRVSGLRAENFGDLIFLDHESGKVEDKTFGFLIVSDGATSHMTAYP